MSILECCVDCVESAIEAQRGGATRLELCANLIIGGTTPDISLFHAVKRHTQIPVHVLLRPRFGDFCYSDFEFDILQENVRMFRDAGADGVVIGILRPDGTLDSARMRALVALAGDLHVTLHRAFDVCRDPFEALEEARALGVRTILTSGQKNACTLGKSLLRELKTQANGVDILVGGGVTSANIAELCRVIGTTSFHMSGKMTIESEMTFRKEDVSMGLPVLSEYTIWRTNAKEVADAKRALDLAITTL